MVRLPREAAFQRMPPASHTDLEKSQVMQRNLHAFESRFMLSPHRWGRTARKNRWSADMTTIRIAATVARIRRESAVENRPRLGER